MSAATETAPVQGPSYKIVQRLDGVPAIHDTVTYADTLLKSYSATAYLYSIATSVATRSYNIASPVINRTQPIINTADGLAAYTFDRAQATFPYPFKTPTQDLIVVKQSKAVYDARIAPMLQQYQPVVHDVLTKTAEINSALGARAQATLGVSKEYADHLVEQLKHLAEQGRVLPGHLIEGVQRTSNDLRQIVLAKDSTIQEKSNKVGAYVIDQVKPVVDEIYNYLLGAKRKAEEAAAKAADETADKVHGAAQ